METIFRKKIEAARSNEEQNKWQNMNVTRENWKRWQAETQTHRLVVRVMRKWKNK